MFQVPNSQIAAVGNSGGFTVPTAVDLTCPECRAFVTFTLPTWTTQQTRGLPINGRCPRCSVQTTFIRLGGPSRNDIRLYVDAESMERPALAGLDELPFALFSDRLQRAYAAALKALSHGDPEATAVHCRRVLEGITGDLLPSENRPKTLARRIESLAQHNDLLAKPLLDLSRSLKDGGNLGAHFDDETDTTYDDAAHMLGLLENLITYLYVLPQRIKRFREEVLGEEPDNSHPLTGEA